MARKRKLVDILDVERFERAKAKIVGLGEALGRREKITDAKALRAMVNVAATMWGADDEGGKLLLVDWSAAGKHIVSDRRAVGPMRLSPSTSQAWLKP